MRYIVAAIAIGCFLSGLIVFFIGLRELVRKWISRHRFESAEGIVIRVTQKRLNSQSEGRSKMTYMNFPVVTFKTQDGMEITFTSETGDSGFESKYATGQTLAVLYDPAGQFPPMEHSWSGVWLPCLMGMFAGCGFLSASVVITWFFWSKITGK